MKLGEMSERDELDTVFALRVRRVGGRLGNQSGNAELAQPVTISGTRYQRPPFPAIRYLGPVRRVTRGVQ